MISEGLIGSLQVGGERRERGKSTERTRKDEQLEKKENESNGEKVNALFVLPLPLLVVLPPSQESPDRTTQHVSLTSTSSTAARRARDERFRAVRDPVFATFLHDRWSVEGLRNERGDSSGVGGFVDVLQVSMKGKKAQRSVRLKERRGNAGDATHQLLRQPLELNDIRRQHRSLVPLDNARVVLNQEETIGVNDDVKLVFPRELDGDPGGKLHVVGATEAVGNKSASCTSRRGTEGEQKGGKERRKRTQDR